MNYQELIVESKKIIQEAENKIADLNRANFDHADLIIVTAYQVEESNHEYMSEQVKSIEKMNSQVKKLQLDMREHLSIVWNEDKEMLECFDNMCRGLEWQA